MKTLVIKALSLGVVTWGLVSCATPSNSAFQDDVQKTLAMSFRAEGQAGMERLKQDEANKLCSEAEYKGKPLSDKQIGRAHV